MHACVKNTMQIERWLSEATLPFSNILPPLTHIHTVQPGGMEELSKGGKHTKEANTQRQALKLKILLIIQIWKPSNTEKEDKRDQPVDTLMGTIMQMLK